MISDKSLHLNKGQQWDKLACWLYTQVNTLHKHTRLNFNIRPLVQKHVKIILDEWILQTTHPGKHINFSEQYFTFCVNIYFVK